MKRDRRLLVFSCTVLFLFGYFPSRFRGGNTPLISSLMIMALALPCLYSLCKWLGLAKASTVLVVLGISAIVVEAGAVVTGFPYGSFHYSESMGYRLFGLVPWSLPFAYVPILTGVVTVANHLVGSSRWRLTMMSAALAVAVDLVLDPAAVYQGFWYWSEPGIYYGVPIINFVGWFLTGLVYSNIFHFIVRDALCHCPVIPLRVSLSLLMGLSFWTGVLIWIGLTIPVFLGAILMVIMFCMFFGVQPGFWDIR